MSLRVERPRETSKSAPNNGALGMQSRAEAISFCSAAEGVHTLSMLTFTCGCDAGGVAGASWAATCGARARARKPLNKTGRKAAINVGITILGTILGAILGTAEF